MYDRSFFYYRFFLTILSSDLFFHILLFTYYFFFLRNRDEVFLSRIVRAIDRLVIVFILRSIHYVYLS